MTSSKSYPTQALPVASRAKEAPGKMTDTLLETETSTQVESHIYVHCYFTNPGTDMLIRIWRTTFLIDAASKFRSRLVHAENISYAPQWTLVPDRKEFHFLLIFEGLPKTCTLFNLVEDIPQSGGFYIESISRNTTDVYHIDIM